MGRKKDNNGIWLIDSFYGGLSDGSRRGYVGAFRAGVGLDYRTDPDILSGLRKFKKDSGTTITDIPIWMVTQGENLWVYGNTGKIYLRDSSGTWSNPKTVSNSHGNGLAVFDDYLYYAYDKGFGRYGPLSGTPAWDDDFLIGGNESDASLVSTANTYTLTTSVNEGATHRQTWTSVETLVYGVVVYLNAKGTGDWSLIVHDASNTELGRATIANADLLGSAGYVKFVFPNAITVTTATSYHFHLISTVAGGSVKAGTTNDLETATFSIHTYVDPNDVDVSEEVSLITTTVANTYTLPTAISEASTGKREFIPDKHNIVAISAQVATGGSATYTLKLHDDEDVLLATSTKTSTDIGNLGFVRFDFSSAVKVVPGATYHFHLTVDGGTHTLFSVTASSMADAGYKVHYQILDENDYHPMVFFPSAGALAIGNGNFLALYDGIVYRTTGQGDGSERLKFAQEENVRCLKLVADYLAVGTWKGDGVDDHGQSRLYLWDGTSTFINAFKDIVGEINAIEPDSDGLLHIIHGGFGQISIYDGGLTLVKTIPAVGENKYIEVYPGAITTWNGIVRFGISAGDSTTVKRGVYSYGRINKDYPRSLNLDAPISTGNNGSTVQITSMLGVGPSKFFIGWKDGASHGVDIIDTANDQGTASLESLIFDAGIPYFEKKSRTIKLTFPALAKNQEIKLYTKINRALDWTLLGSASYASDGAIIEKDFAFDYRWKELELKIELITSGATSPGLISCTTFFEIVTDEQE